MPDAVTFMMGNYAAVLPTDRRYCRNHMWCQPAGDALRFGFSSYAVRLMQDVYFLDWQVNAGDAVKILQQIGHIETSKATADLFAPVGGVIRRFNEAILADPSPINLDGYGDGWIFEMTEPADPTLSAEEYKSFLESTWEETQRHLKGHI
jgi:glycine cleavage system H protein